MLDSDLYDRNVAFLSEAFPELKAHLGAKNTGITPVWTDGVATDIQIVGQRLYKGDARQISDQQVQEYLKKPTQAGYDASDFCSDSLISRSAFLKLRQGMAEYDLKVIPAAPVVRVGFILIFGIGLGYHLKKLIESVDVENVIVTDVVGEFLDMSCHAVDWSELSALCEAKGAKLHIRIDGVPLHLYNDIGVIISRAGPVLLDGIYCFRHYPLWALDEAYRMTINEFPRVIIARGYYEDERKMMRNAVTNLYKSSYYLVEGAFRVRTHIPAFIIASGPSVDESIEYIKEWREHAIVFSCGSSLQICLKHGIIPDYHVELENVVAVKDFLDHILEKNLDRFPNKKFDGIKLIASVTVNPQVLPYFDEKYFFFRDSSVSTKCFADKVPIMSAVGPNVSNTAVAVAARLGFRNMYFFGFDCGWRNAKVHHSKDTAYYTSEEFKSGEAKGTAIVPGNFGGEVYTDIVLDWSRDMLQQKIAHFDLKVFNCSDGANIEGAIPLLAEAMSFSGPEVDRTALMDAIRKDSYHFKEGEYLERFDMAEFIAEADAYRDELYPLIDQAIEQKLTFLEFHALIWPMLLGAAQNPKYKRIEVMFSCATLGLMKLACYYLNRIEDPEIREILTLRFFHDFKAQHEDFLTDGRQVLEEARIMVEGGPEPEWTKGLPTTAGTTY